jgi:tryptophan-rich sensory protein
MTIRQTLSSAFSQRTGLRRLLYSGWVVAVVGLIAGILTIWVLWQYNPMIALLCIPMAASVLTALALMFALPVKNRRQRLR